jgi:cbb3-type cytochrome oxidase subunit 3
MKIKLLNNRIIFLGLMVCLLLSLVLIYFIFKPEAQKHENDLNQQNQLSSENNNIQKIDDTNHQGKYQILRRLYRAQK